MNNRPIFRNATLESLSRNILKSYDASLLITPQPVPIEIIMEQKYGLCFDYQYIRNNGRILGETVFNDALVPIYDHEHCKYTLMPAKGGTVIIDASMLDNRSDGRFRFTCAHELAHWVIHHEYYVGLNETAAMTEAVRSSQTDKAIERQADRLGGYMLMPAGAVKKAFYQARGNKVNELSSIFDVSCQAMNIRLKGMGLI